MVSELKYIKEKVNIFEYDYVELNNLKFEVEEFVWIMEEKESILFSLIESKEYEEGLMIKKMIEKDEKILLLLEKL